MTSGLLLAMTLPGLLLLLILLAVVEQVASRLKRRGVLSRRHRALLGATGLDSGIALVQRRRSPSGP